MISDLFSAGEHSGARLRHGLLLLVGAGLGMIALIFLLTFTGTLALVAALLPSQPVATARVEEVPPDQLAAMQQAADAAGCGLPWQVLAAQAQVASHFGRDLAAGGYAGLRPTDWAAYGGEGDPDDYRDALPALARYLCDHGGTGDLQHALDGLLPGTGAVTTVQAVSVHYGYRPPGSLASQVISLAVAQEGKPYVWGGADPVTSFDCSGLVQWVFMQVGVRLPRTAQQQYDATVHVPDAECLPGDLVFFAHTYDSIEPVTHVGIYLGHNTMVNAPEEGDVIRELPVFSGYWGSHFAGCGRVVVR